MNLDEFIDFLEPQEERPDPKNPGKTLPARGAALCQSASDWNKMKTDLETACKMLGNRCTYEIVEMIETLKSSIDGLQTKVQAKKIVKKVGKD